MGEIVVSGRLAHCDAEVRSLIGTPHEFTARPRITEPEVVMWHWTGGRGDAMQVEGVLRRRGLSINFIIDRDGVVWQCCDAGRATAHAGGKHAVLSSNPRGPGVEVCGVGGDGVWWTREQAGSGRALARSLSTALGLPLDCPRDAAGNVLSTLMTRAALQAFRGHIGHYHVASNKSDPGTAWLAEICDSYGKVAAC